jgi:uncharacterized phiE125 gp8 family phage protein
MSARFVPILVTGPVLEPVSLEDLKLWLRIDTSEEETLLTALITSARLIVEAVTRRILITQTWRLVGSAWPIDEVLPLSLSPVQSVASARIFDEAGTPTSIDLAKLTLETTGNDFALRFKNDLPTPTRPFSGIEIECVCGYGNAEAVPEPLRLAIRMIATYWYENRGDIVQTTVDNLPPGVKSLLQPYKRIRV